MLWVGALAVLAAIRVAIPLAALAAEGSQLPGLPRYSFVALSGDATGFYAAAREFMASWGRLPPAVVVTLALAVLAGAAAFVAGWRGYRDRRAWLLAGAALAAALVVTAGVSQMNPPGAAVFGWPLVWSLPMLPYRALGGPLDPEIAFGFGLTLSLAANAVTIIATAYAGLYATGRRTVGLVAAALYAFWPFLTGLVGGSRAWENGSWQIDAGLHLYTEPLSTALVTTAAALLLHPRRTPLRLAGAGAVLSLATTVKLSNGFAAVLGLAILVVAIGARRSLPFLAGGLSFAPVVAAYWPLGYVQVFDNPVSFPRVPFALDYAARSWSESLLFTPRTVLLLAPLAVAGAFLVRRGAALALLLAWTLVNPAFYSFYANTPLHPRFLYASLPTFFVLWAAGAAAIWPSVASRGLPSPRRRATRTA